MFSTVDKYAQIVPRNLGCLKPMTDPAGKLLRNYLKLRLTKQTLAH